MSFRSVYTVFKKELLTLLRDRGVLFTNFFVPLFGLPLYFIFVFESASFMAKEEAKTTQDATQYQVSYQGSLPTDFIEGIKDSKKVNFFKNKEIISPLEIKTYLETMSHYEALNKATPRAEIILQNHDKNELEVKRLAVSKAKRAYITSYNKLKEKIVPDSDVHLVYLKGEENQQDRYLLFYDENKNISRWGKFWVTNLLESYESKLVAVNKEKKGITQRELNPLLIKDISLAKLSKDLTKTIGLSLGGIILFLLLIFTLNPTINTTIGERDGHTYKLLLMNPISPYEIFLGKYLAVAFQGLITLIPYGIEVIIGYTWASSNLIFASLPPVTPMKLTILIVGITGVAIAVSSICFLISSFTRTRSQAQSLQTLLMFLVAVPMGMIGVLDIGLSIETVFLPVLNFPLTVENLLVAESNLFLCLGSFAVNVVFSLALIWLSLGAFLVQWKGSSDTTTFTDLLTFKSSKSKKLSPAHAFLGFAISYLGHSYGGAIFKLFDAEFAVLFFTPLLFSLGVSIALFHHSGLDLTRAIRWNLPGLKEVFRYFIGAFLLNLVFGVSFTSLGFGEVLKDVYPQPFGMNSFFSLLSTFFLVSLIPSFCHEFLFRGLIYKGFRNQYGLLLSTVTSAIFFAIVQFSIGGFALAFVLGLITAVIYERKGIVSSMLFHCFFTSIAAAMAYSPQFQSYLEGIPPLASLLFLPITVAMGLNLALPQLNKRAFLSLAQRKNSPKKSEREMPSQEDDLAS